MEKEIQGILPFNGKSIIKPRKLDIKEYELIRKYCCNTDLGCFCLGFESLDYCGCVYKAAEEIFLKNKTDFKSRVQGRASEYIKQFWEERDGICEDCGKSFHRYRFKEDWLKLNHNQLCEHCEESWKEGLLEDGGFEEEMPESFLEYMLDDIDKEDKACEEAWFDVEKNLDRYLLELIHSGNKTVISTCHF